MSVLVLEQITKGHKYHGFQIVRQVLPKRCILDRRYMESAWVLPGTRYVVCSRCSPQWAHLNMDDGIYQCLWCRGSALSADGNILDVPVAQLGAFKHLLLEFNRAHSNNTDLELGDVLWKEDA